MTHTKMFKIKMMLLLVAALLIGFTMHAQVTIGSGEAPIPGSLLQLKDKPNVSDGGFNANKGVALPRVLLTEKDQLFPMFESDGAGGYKIGATPYVKADEDKTHTGLFVYNLTEDENQDLYPGLYQWDGTEWKSFETKMPEAVFEPSPDCSQYVVHGTYIKDKALDNSNYLTVAVDVTKAGAYAIIVDAIDASGTMNGYGFTGSGTFLNTGLQTVDLQAQGKPINVHSDPANPAVGDSVKFIAQGTVRVVPSCVVVPVVDDVAGYSLSCPSISVNGTYIKGTSLDASNTITIRVAVGAVGSYSIEGSSNAGISFKATGFFPSVGSHTVTLTGTGKPTVNTDIPITIRSNSPDDNTLCSAVAKITLPAMTYAIIGSSDYSWNTVRKTAINNGASFGLSGIVKMAGFTNLWQEDTATDAIPRMSEVVKPDIILYFAFGANPNASSAAALPGLLADYVKAGGVLIYGSIDDDVTGTNLLLNGIFGAGAGTAGQSSANPNDNDYQINTLPNDPIINGPFGNLSGKFWGEDNWGSVYVGELPPNSVQVCAANNQASNINVNPEYSMIWYNEKLNFAYFGDSPGSSASSTASNGYPTIYQNGLPKSKPYGTYATGNGNPYVYNAALEFNVLAWGIKKAATSGINPY